MISLTELRVTAETGQSIRLGPYRYQQFASLFPLPESNLTYVPTQYIKEGYGDLERESEWLHNYGSIDWGIFVPHDDAEQFVGEISLTTGGKIERHMDTRIAIEDARSRGIGTLAKAAVADFAFRREATAVRSVTANPASKVSLSRLGFVDYGPLDPPELCGREGTLMERNHFVLWNEFSYAVPKPTEAIDGRRRFNAILKTLHIAEKIVDPAVLLP